jgi:hypothetical protein
MNECLLHVLRTSLKFLAAHIARAVAALQEPLHMFWRTLSMAVMKQNKAGIPVFVVINKKDDDRRGALR